MFHKQREKVDTHLINPHNNELYILYGLVPVSFCLNCFCTMLVCILAFTQIFMRIEKNSILVQVMCLPMYLKMVYLLDGFGHLRWTIVSLCFFTVMLYTACIDILTWFGVANIKFYQIKVIKDAHEEKVQPLGALVFITAQLCVMWLVCGQFKQQEVYYICYVLLGYLMYRVWAYALSLKNTRAIRCFPFANFSSATFIFLFTLMSEMPQVYQFLLSLLDSGSGMSRLDCITVNYVRQATAEQLKQRSQISTEEINAIESSDYTHQILLIFQISGVLAAFQKYYEFKNFVELLQYKRAIEKCKEDFYEMINTYRAELLNHWPVSKLDFNKKIDLSVPSPSVAASASSTSECSRHYDCCDEGHSEKKASEVSYPVLIHATWQVFFFVAVMMSTFGATLENHRLLFCGYYIMFELANEMLSAGMNWMERRQPIYEYMIEMVFSEEDKKAVLRDGNGRELPQWLKEAEENDIREKIEKLPNFSKKTILLNYCLNYGVKGWLLYQFITAQPRKA